MGVNYLLSQDQYRINVMGRIQMHNLEIASLAPYH